MGRIGETPWVSSEEWKIEGVAGHREAFDRTYFEEVLRGAAGERAVLDLGLFGEVVGVLDRRQHALDGEERRQVGRVRRDDDEREEPPRAADDPTRQRPVA